MKRRTFLQAAGYAALYGGLAADLAKSAWALSPKEIAGADPDLHLLRRISFGPVKQELERVRQIGRSAYIDEQLAASDAFTDLKAGAFWPYTLLDATTLFTASAGGFLLDNCIAQLQAAKVYKAMFSQAQLFEVMVDFWNDHFNTYIRKNPVPLKLVFDQVIRANALGNFKILLKATVHHPEMLHYLDNWMNAKGAINENYARELLELHTLGKNGGYTETDMKNLARILSGLTYPADPLAGLVLGYGRYSFDPNKHDTDAKTFLGQSFPAGGGEAEIDRAINLIADHPGTARHIATKMCKRFISDDPPAAIVDRVAAAYASSNGDIKQMLSVLLKSGEFADSSGQKVKRPLEAMVGAVRACGINMYDQLLNADIFGTAGNGGGVLIQSMIAAGHQPFAWVPPNGYPDSNAYWTNTNSLLQQERFAVRLVETMHFGRLLQSPPDFILKGNSVAVGVADATTPREAVSHAMANLLFLELPEESVVSAIAFVAQDADPDAAMDAATLETRIKGLVFALLSSPWFLLR